MVSLSRYSSLSEAHRQAFCSEEDTLLSLVLHNLLVYMLMVGLSPEETTDLIHRLMARTRLATAEERLVQQTLEHMEQNVREGGGQVYRGYFVWVGGDVGGRMEWEGGVGGWVGGVGGWVVIGGRTDLNRCSCNTNVHPFGQKTSVDLFPTCLKHTPSQTSTEVDLSDLGLLALYSEIHPTISYMVST